MRATRRLGRRSTATPSMPATILPPGTFEVTRGCAHEDLGMDAKPEAANIRVPSGTCRPDGLNRTNDRGDRDVGGRLTM